MDEGDGERVFVGQDDGVVKTPGFSKSKLIWITVSVGIFVLLFLVFYFVFINNSGDENILVDGIQNEYSGEYLSEVEKCLEKEMNDKCLKLFLNSELYQECKNLGNLKDKCLYYTAILNGDGSLCPSIQDDLFKTKCEKEVFITGEI